MHTFYDFDRTNQESIIKEKQRNIHTLFNCDDRAKQRIMITYNFLTDLKSICFVWLEISRKILNVIKFPLTKYEIKQNQTSSIEESYILHCFRYNT